MSRILTWNIACLPSQINMFRNPNKKIKEIIDKIKNTKSAIICLQEVFDYNIQKILSDSFEKDYKIYHSNETYYSLIPKNGLFIASKYPILEHHEYAFKNKEGIESFVDKGVISIIIDHEILGKTAIHNTHMQSDTLFWPYYASIKNRQKQQKELKQYLNKDNFKNITNILCGDMNDKYNYISDLCNSQINLTQMNEEELITFPYSQCQLDYILFNKTKQNYEINYKCLNSTENKLSDHNMLLCEINLSTCGDSGYNGDSDESINSN
jgi:endonuclease/exonuclease/phosphatase family metal-dependent hydrolase